MQENRGGALNFELPPQPPSPESDRGQEKSVEAPSARPETSGNQPQQPALPVIPDDLPVADQPLITAPAQDIATNAPIGSKAAATDSDRIEREWVDKVKSVVAKTHEDPHLQKEQMSRIKAEYIQKRFNKTIKTDEAAA